MCNLFAIKKKLFIKIAYGILKNKKLSFLLMFLVTNTVHLLVKE